MMYLSIELGDVSWNFTYVFDFILGANHELLVLTMAMENFGAFVAEL